MTLDALMMCLVTETKWVSHVWKETLVSWLHTDCRRGLYDAQLTFAKLCGWWKSLPSIPFIFFLYTYQVIASSNVWMSSAGCLLPYTMELSSRPHHGDAPPSQQRWCWGRGGGHFQSQDVWQTVRLPLRKPNQWLTGNSLHQEGNIGMSHESLRILELAILGY